MRRSLLALLAVALCASVASAQTPAPAEPVPDITGRWTASFDTQVGMQEYTYDFVVEGSALTGTIVSNMGGKAEVREGRVDGRSVSFKETLVFMEMQIDISYQGEIVSADEIRFTRQVGEFATEELVARRSR